MFLFNLKNSVIFPTYCVLLHSGVRWQSAGRTIKQFSVLRNFILQFEKNENKKDTEDIENKFTKVTFLTELAFFTDIINHLDFLNLNRMSKIKLCPICPHPLTVFETN